MNTLKKNPIPLAALIFAVILTSCSLNAPADQPTEELSWKKVLEKDLLPTLEYVLEQVETSSHVKPIIYRDKELSFIKEEQMAGIDSFRDKSESLLEDREVHTLLHDEVFNPRAQEISDMKFGMFICWSFSTFYGEEWTPTLDKDASFFKATGCDTDQWCKVAKDAGMAYILFLSKHHDGFCLWDTETTEKKVTNSPLGTDVLAKLRKSCDKYGIKLALYFSEGDWNWPGAVDGKGHAQGKGLDPEMKKAQLKELCTQYGPIEFFWMDHAVGDGGLSHEKTVRWVHQFQPDCFVGFNHGEPAGRLSLRELGKPGPIGDASATKYNKEAEATYKGYLAAEFTYPILPPHKGGAMWFYSLPEHDSLCHSPQKIYQDYLGAVKYGNIFSLDVGPDYQGKIREIDVRTLQKVGALIKKSKPDQI